MFLSPKEDTLLHFCLFFTIETGGGTSNEVSLLDTQSGRRGWAPGASEEASPSQLADPSDMRSDAAGCAALIAVLGLVTACWVL